MSSRTRARSNAECLERLAGQMRDGSWAIWGEIAKRRLEVQRPPCLFDVDAYAECIRRCGESQLLSEGRRIHWELSTVSMDEHKYLGNLLVQMYGNCRKVQDAEAAFWRTRGRNLYSWNIMLSAFVHNGQLRRARELLDKVPQTNLITWNALHAAYARHGELEPAKELFDQMTERDPVSWNTMIALYAQKGHIDQAKVLFDDMPERTVVSWNSMVASYFWARKLDEAKLVFDRTPCQNVVGMNTIVTALAEAGQVLDARSCYDSLPERDVVSWTALIMGYAQSGDMSSAREMFRRMPLLDEVSLTAMITSYARNGHMQEGKELFDMVGTRDACSWNAMIIGYAQNGQGKKALQIFAFMDLEGITLDKITFFYVFEACVGLVSLAEARTLHGIARDSGMLAEEVEVGNNLVAMYGKCGSLNDAMAVFLEMQTRTLVSWNSLITAYTKNGECEEAVRIFRLMLADGQLPDDIAFLTTLSGCSHSGLLKDGVECFRSIFDHGLDPGLDQYMCVVDLLGRVGHLAGAEDLMQNMPFEPKREAWRSLLAACRVHGDSERGSRLGEEFMGTETVTSGSFMLLSNIYSSLPKDQAG